MRVGFDLDGTLVDMLAVLRREAERLLGAAGLPKPRWDHTANADSGDDSEIAELQLNGRQQLLLWDHINAAPDFWKGLPEVESGIVARIAQTAMRRGWEVIFLTTRPLVAGETTQMQSQRWLEAHGFPLPSVVVVQRSIGQIADALDLDAVVDDRFANCLDVSAASKAQPILMWYGHPTRVPRGTKRTGVRVATSISEALSLLEQLDDLKNEKERRQVNQEVPR